MYHTCYFFSLWCGVQKYPTGPFMWFFGKVLNTLTVHVVRSELSFNCVRSNFVFIFERRGHLSPLQVLLSLMGKCCTIRSKMQTWHSYTQSSFNDMYSECVSRVKWFKKLFCFHKIECSPQVYLLLYYEESYEYLCYFMWSCNYRKCLFNFYLPLRETTHFIIWQYDSFKDKTSVTRK